MTSMPASRSARAMIFAPRSCPSSPGFATTTRIFRLDMARGDYPRRADVGRRIIPAAYSGCARRLTTAPRPTISRPSTASATTAPPVAGSDELEMESVAVVSLLPLDDAPPADPEPVSEPLPDPEPDSPPALAARTVTVPFMNGCGLQ